MVTLLAPSFSGPGSCPTICLLRAWQFLPVLFREPKQSTVVQMSQQSIKRLFSIPSLITPNDFFLELSVMTRECFASEVTASSGTLNWASWWAATTSHFLGVFYDSNNYLINPRKCIIDKFCRFFYFIPSFQLSIICLTAISCIQNAGHYFLQGFTEKLLTSCHKSLIMKCTPVHDDIIAVLRSWVKPVKEPEKKQDAYKVPGTHKDSTRLYFPVSHAIKTSHWELHTDLLAL